MGSEPIKNEDNKVMAILGWLSWIGIIVYLVAGKNKEDDQLKYIFYQVLLISIIQIVCIMLFFLILTYIFAIVLSVFILIGFILAITGKVWDAPLVSGWAKKKTYGE